MFWKVKPAVYFALYTPPSSTNTTVPAVGFVTIVGGPGEDLISGGVGNDHLTGNGGFDWVQGGEGDDQLDLRDGGVDRGVCGEGSDEAIADAVDSLGECEFVDLPASSSGTTAQSAASAPIAPAAKGSSPPDTTGLKGPKSVRRGNKATFRFGSSTKGSSFKCMIDKGPFKACKSPFHLSTAELSPGRHTIAVVAVDAAGVADPKPATLKFAVVPKPKLRKHGTS